MFIPSTFIRPVLFCYIKQKTAYEMRISDWSSDVCSSDLCWAARPAQGVYVAQGNYLFTSESVSEGHPDKICDAVSDAIVDAYLHEEPVARCGVETLVTTNLIVVAGETRGAPGITHDRIEEIARRAVREIGYDQDNFHWKNSKVLVHVHNQSADIAVGVDSAGNKDEGAGDQGLMFGYACRETPVLMPAPIYYAHEILKSLSKARHAGEVPDLGPDMKSQVTLEYRDGQPVRATSVVVSAQHSERVDQDFVRKLVLPHIQE